MELYYVSPSVLPSRTANSVHVVQQCEAFDQLGIKTTLFAKRSIPGKVETIQAIRKNYGVRFSNITFISFFNRMSLADNIGICCQSLRHVPTRSKNRMILSRNLYASFFLAVVKRQPLIFETHQLEFGFRRYLQLATMIQPHVITVVISQRLLEILSLYHGRAPENPLILHDAAPKGIQPHRKGDKKQVLKRLFPEMRSALNHNVVGYFGHLYSGRGLSVIENLALKHPNVTFIVFGGNESQVNCRRQDCRQSNLYFMGHVSHPVAQSTMAACDVLLMPYQRSVSIGVDGHDTARWMSPMKMFEYLASGTPIISSDLPPLREVLRDGVNALMVPPDDHEKWSAALNRLLSNKELAERIGQSGHEAYARHHTWDIRANTLLKAASA